MAKVTKFLKVLLWITLGISAALIIGWWLWQLLRENEEEEEEAMWTPPPPPQEISIPMPDVTEEMAAVPPDVPSDNGHADDLTRIDGIGPKYAQALQELGIATFVTLAQQDPDDLAARLRERGVRIIGDRIRQSDWIGQAQRLARES